MLNIIQISINSLAPILLIITVGISKIDVKVQQYLIVILKNVKIMLILVLKIK